MIVTFRDVRAEKGQPKWANLLQLINELLLVQRP